MPISAYGGWSITNNYVLTTRRYNDPNWLVGLSASKLIGSGTPTVNTYLNGLGQWATPSGSSGAAGVTFVGLSGPSGIVVLGSPVTSSGTISFATNITGLVKGSNSGFYQAVAGTDYLTPTGNGSALTGLTSSQITGNFPQSQVTSLVSDLAGKVNIGDAVLLTGNQTVSGVKTFASTIVGSINGNAATVTNGVYTSSSYADPSWLTSLASSKLTGQVAIANGGTGQATASAAINALLPSQTSNSGQYLSTDGLNPKWTGITASASALATYIVQTSSNSPANAQVLASLATGILKNTTTTGVLSIAVSGTDYLAPAGNGSALTGLTSSQITGNFPQSQITNLVSDLAAKAADSSVVHLTGNETVAGIKTFSSTIVGSINGNAATVTNGIYTSSTYADPSWLTSLAASKITGQLSVANGGTGQSTANAAFNALAPSQTSQSGKYLSTNGVDTAWSTLPTAPSALATYIVQTSTNAPTNAQILASLSTGLVKVTTTTGILSTAVAGTDYLSPTGNGSALTGLTSSQITGNFPESQVTNLVSDLALKAPLASPSFTGTVTIGTLTGLLKASTGTVSAAAAGTDYLSPTGNGSALTGLTSSQITGVFGVSNGGTSFSTYTLGDLIYSSATNTLSKLAGNITTTRKFLSQTGNSTISAAPAWNALVSGDIPDLSATYSVLAGNTSLVTLGTVTTGTWSATTIAVNKGGTGQTSYTDGQLLIGNSTGNTLTKGTITAGTNITVTNGNGTITIGQTTAAANASATYIVQTVTNAPANAQVLASLATGIVKNTTTTGVLSIAAAGTDYLAPAGNGSALTGLTGSQISGNISGNAANVTGTVAIANGGTGQTAKAAAYDALNPNTTLGDITYRDASANIRLAGNTTTTKKLLTQTGNGSVSAAPGWNVLVAGDIPDLSATYSPVAGNTSLVTVGTIATGTWNATTIAINKGGTGQTTASAAINALLPTQTAQSGKYLSTDGVNPSWTAVSAGGANSLGTYIVQTATNAPANAQILGSLATGLVKNTTTTGVLSIATANTDYVTPTGNGSSLTFNTGITAAAGTITSSTPFTTSSATWNASAVQFKHQVINITDTASLGSSLVEQVNVGGVEKYRIDKQGNVKGTSFESTQYKKWIYQKDAGATTISRFGAAAPTENQTPTAVQNTRGDWLNYATPATSNTVGGWTPPAFTQTTLDLGPIVTMIVEFANSTDYTTNGAIWCALTSDVLATQTSSNGVALVGFRVLQSDTNWQVVTNNGSSGGPVVTTVTNSGITVSTNTKYILRIDASNSASVKFYINGTLVATSTSNLPTTSTQLGLNITNLTTSNASKTIRISLAQVEQIA